MKFKYKELRSTEPFYIRKINKNIANIDPEFTYNKILQMTNNEYLRQNQHLSLKEKALAFY